MKVLNYIKGDRVIWTIVFLLSILSILVVYSSVAAIAVRYKEGNSGYYLIKHSMIVGFGLLIIYFVHKVKYMYFSRISQIAIYLSIPLLLYTMARGVTAGGATRWIPVFGLTFQTSDFAKLALIMYLARILSKKQDQMQDFKTGFLPIVIPIIVICGLILPSNFSTAAILFVTCFVIMFIGRVNAKFLLSLTGIGIASLAIIIFLIFQFPEALPRGPTWKARIESFINGDSESNFQAEQAQIAIASGGFTGKKPGQSSQRYFLPQASSDFIFAILIEEYGSVVGGIFIVFLYLVLLFRSVRIVTKCEKTFGSLLAVGLGFSLVFQAMINMAVATSLFPVTGQPLPLMSMGGTSIWFTSIAIGIILSVSREVEQSEKTKEVAST